ncbi:MAG: winged helix DNA-binding protein [Planctomycetaceae bacterium]|nr:winged helix DNA-binding protein [Planctomycetaceae bacterium]
MPSKNTIDGIMQFAGRLEGIEQTTLREGLEIARLHHQVEQVIENDLAGWGLTARQIEIMELLFHSEDGTSTPAALSEEVSLTRSAMTSALDSLEKLGHTVRTPHPGDRRMVAVSLTPSGRSFISRHLPERYRRICSVVNVLSQRERTAMLNSYQKVLDALVRELQKKQKAPPERRTGVNA